jgi:abequosyltransferase
MNGTSTTGPAGSPPLLTIAIPTYNRAGYLAQNLAQLRDEMRDVPPGRVEILVSDNCSPDATPQVVRDIVRDGLPVRYVRNAENLGWGRNFAQCFDLARGRYVLLFGDDDLLIDGALRQLLDRLEGHEWGVVCVRPYGFDVDWRGEYPGGGGRDRAFRDPSEFLLAIGALMTLTSSCIINKALIPDVDSGQFSAGDLGALQFVLRAALAAPENLFVDRYLIASKRQNSFNYDYAQVFVTELWRIMDAHVPFGFQPQAIRAYERSMLWSYYPFYMLDLRLARRADPRRTAATFAARFGGRPLYELWVAPTLRLPRPLAIAWGAATTFLGRAMGGELRRGVKFAWHRARRTLRRRRPPITVEESTVR